MKFPHALSLVAAILFVALGVASVLLDVELRELRIDIGAQEEQLRLAEARIGEQMRALQAVDEKKEWQEQANYALRKEVVQQQTAVQSQQELINQGTVLTQQIGPNLLHDIANASMKNAKMKDLLAKHGYTVQAK